MNAPAKKSVTALAAEAKARHEAGQVSASLVLEAQTLSREDRAYLAEQAKADPEMRQAIEDMAEAQELIFTDASARVQYLRAKWVLMQDQQHMTIDTVMPLLFSSLSTKMFVKGKSAAAQPAIPLFQSYRDRSDALRSTKNPLGLPSAFRKNRGKKDDFISARGRVYVAPVSPFDKEAFAAMQAVWARVCDGFVGWVESHPETKVREIVWYGVHCMPGTRVMDQEGFARLMEAAGKGIFKEKGRGQEYVRFDLSPKELFFLPNNERNVEFVNGLKARVSGTKTAVDESAPDASPFAVLADTVADGTTA